MDDLFYLIDSENLHNFSDDNSLSDIEKLVPELGKLPPTAISWMEIVA